MERSSIASEINNDPVLYRLTLAMHNIVFYEMTLYSANFILL